MMNYHYAPDANEMSARHERYEHRSGKEESVNDTPLGTPLGTLTVYQSAHLGEIGSLIWDQPLVLKEVSLDLKFPGQIVAYDLNGMAHIVMLSPGSYTTFLPDERK